MDTELRDEPLVDLIVRAYQDEHLAVPRADIEHRGHWSIRYRRVLLATTAAAAVTVLAGTVGWFFAGPAGPLQPATPTTEPTTGNGKPVRPTSTATTDLGRCTDYGRVELGRAESVAQGDRTELPPLRFTRPAQAGAPALLIFATEQVTVACWLDGELWSISVNSSDMTTTMTLRHPPGRISNATSSGPEGFAYTFGRVPAGTTEVTIEFSSGPTLPAQLAGEWYLAFAAGDQVDRFAEINRIVASTPTGTQSLPVRHG